MAISSHDIVPDSPTNVFATLNPLRAGTQNLADGNLKISAESENHWSTIGVDPNDTNKYYFEMLVITQKTSEQLVGVSNQSGSKTNYLGSDANGWGIAFQSNANNGDLANNNSLTSSGVTFSANDIIQVCFTATKIWFGKNGTFIGNPSTETSPSFSNLSGTLSAVITNRDASGGSTRVNFGQDHLFGGATLPSGAGSNTPDNGIGTFAFSVPSSAKALCTANLPDPAIDPAVDDVPSDYMRPVVISGTNADNNNVFVGFQPDLCWLKKRNGASGHMIVDSVRGAGYALQSDNTGTEGTYNIANDFKEFTSTGFNLGQVSAYGSSNPAGTNNIISWCWKAGGAPTATDDGNGVSGSAKLVNTSGTGSTTTCKSFKDAAVTAGASNVICPSKMSINQKSGFSIVKYSGNSTSGATIPHGLSSAPEFVIIKNLTDSVSAKWGVFHKDSISSGVLYLDDTAAAASADTNVFNSLNASTISTINTITIGNYNGTNGNGDEHIMYCWHSVAGYSAFSSYTGNGSTDGTFVYTGFKPAWVMIKSSSYTTTTYTSWAIYDNARETYNPNNNVLYANKNINEGKRGNATTAATDIDVDFLSNGFKVRSDKAEINQDTETYIYAAFAEQPFKYANAR